MDTNEEILNKKKQCNEAKTDRELQTQYKNEEIKGKLACKNRLNNMMQSHLRDQIKEYNDNIAVEKEVSKRI